MQIIIQVMVEEMGEVEEMAEEEERVEEVNKEKQERQTLLMKMGIH